MFCCSFLYDPSSFAIILMGKRELVALLSLSSWCLVIVVWFFLAVPLVILQFMIVAFPDHSHYYFVNSINVLVVIMKFSYHSCNFGIYNEWHSSHC